jgi:hypothetical protein
MRRQIILNFLVLFVAGVGSANDVNDGARFLAGLPSVNGETKWRESSAWKTHESAMSREWAAYGKSTLKPMTTWSGSEIVPSAGRGSLVRYMFSGPDILHALCMFPESDGFLMCGLEPVGVAPDLKRLSNYSASVALGQVRKSLEEIIHYSFFKTKDMKVDLRKSAFPGTTPLISLFLAASDQTIDGVEFLNLKADGTLEEAIEGSAMAVRVRFGSNHNRERWLIYFQTNVADDGIEPSGFLTFLESQPKGAAYMKAASFLMHYSYFSKVRNHLLTHSKVLVQDDSGIPYRHYGDGWDVNCYGAYKGPIPLFKEFYQKDLSRAFLRGAEDLPFGTGYRWRKNDSNLMVAVKGKARKAEPVITVAATPAPVVEKKRVDAGSPSGGPVDLVLKLVAKSDVDAAAMDESRVLGMFEYEVLDVERGNYPLERIRIAHGIVWGGEVTRAMAREVGSTTQFRAVPISTYPVFSKVKVVDTLPKAEGMPVYVPSME